MEVTEKRLAALPADMAALRSEPGELCTAVRLLSNHNAPLRDEVAAEKSSLPPVDSSLALQHIFGITSVFMEFIDQFYESSAVHFFLEARDFARLSDDAGAVRGSLFMISSLASARSLLSCARRSLATCVSAHCVGCLSSE